MNEDNDHVIRLDRFNSYFSIEDKHGRNAVRIIKLESINTVDFLSYPMLCLQVINENELTMFDHSIAGYVNGSNNKVAIIDQEFAVYNYLRIGIDTHGNDVNFEIDVYYE